MAKIPFLYPRRRKSGRTAWHWKPSPRLRNAGWANQLLGEDEGKHPPTAIIEKAYALNKQVEDWDRGFAAVAEAKPVPKKWLFSDLVDAYRASPEYREEIKPGTRKEYDSRIRQLTFWAQDGALPIRQIDQQMVADLKTALLTAGEDGKPPSKFKCAAMLRVLRRLMRWAKGKGLVATDPTHGVAIPTPPSRTKKLDLRGVEQIIATALEADDAATALAVEIAFWSMQRRSDLLALNRFAWRTFESMDPRDRPMLADPKGDVKGFRLQQQKTGKWVDAPMPAFLHERIEGRFAASQWLFPHPADAAKPLPEHQLQRAVRKHFDAAGFHNYQLRDLRRSGMSWANDMGAQKSDIFAISGHAVLGRSSIVDTYMPPDTRAACAAIAAVLRTMRAIQDREEAK